MWIAPSKLKKKTERDGEFPVPYTCLTMDESWICRFRLMVEDKVIFAMKEF
jgi:hypothetical protein